LNSTYENGFSLNIKISFDNFEKSNEINSLKAGHFVATITTSLPIITSSILGSYVINDFISLGKMVIEGSNAEFLHPFYVI